MIFLRGSRRSGGFSIGRVAKIPALFATRILAGGRVARQGRVTLPPETGVQPGDRLLAVRGSGLALGLSARGPIYELALKHPDLGGLLIVSIIDELIASLPDDAAVTVGARGRALDRSVQPALRSRFDVDGQSTAWARQGARRRPVAFQERP